MNKNEKLAKEVLNDCIVDSSVHDLDSSFDTKNRLVRSVWDKCSAPPSVKDWTCNDYVIDYLGYVPIDKMIKRMLEDGARLEAYRETPEYKALYEQSIKDDDERPYDDDLIYADRLTLLETAQNLQAELSEIRNVRKASTKVDTKETLKEEVKNETSETVSTPTTE